MRWEKTAALVLARAWLGVCERCGRRPPSEAHHRWLQGQGGPDDPRNLAALCVFCHKWCHANPAAAVEEGWIVQAPYDYQGTELVLACGMRCLLDEHYGYVITGWEDPPVRAAALRPVAQLLDAAVLAGEHPPAGQDGPLVAFAAAAEAVPVSDHGRHLTTCVTVSTRRGRMARVEPLGLRAAGKMPDQGRHLPVGIAMRPGHNMPAGRFPAGYPHLAAPQVTAVPWPPHHQHEPTT